MSKTARSLPEVLNKILIDGLPRRLKEAINLTLRRGYSKAEVLAIASRRLENAPLVRRAIETYLETK